MYLRQRHRMHYRLSSLLFIVPPVALTEAQVVFLYFIFISCFISIDVYVLEHSISVYISNLSKALVLLNFVLP